LRLFAVGKTEKRTLFVAILILVPLRLRR